MVQRLPFLFLAVLACAERVEGDTGPHSPADGGAVDAGSSDGGSTTPGRLCREVVSDYDEKTAPIAYEDFAYDVLLWNDLDEITWTEALDGSASGTLSLHPELTGERFIVDWVEDGSDEAVFPCLDGPATRAGVRFLASVSPHQASGWLEGWFEGTAEASWSNRVRTTEVTLSESWDGLITSAEAEAGHTGAVRVLSLSVGGGASVIALGSEEGNWARTWWSGDLDGGKTWPASRAPLPARR